tara:strand:- start:754 stop:978 length:225 start_codon:yes stop_codon:yes gene_type:complete
MYNEEQQQLLDGIKMLLNILDSRLPSQPLTEDEVNQIKGYNDDCDLHIIADLLYCKACQGIVVAMTCKEGTPTE